MSKYLLYLLLLLPLYLHAQVSDVVFIGSIQTDDGQSFSYKLYFKDSAGIINGYSITDVMGPNETKTRITGTINGSKKQVRFRETKVISTKNKTTDKSAFLCYLYGTLKASARQGKTVLKGSFKGYKSDGTTTCSSGKLMLVSAKDVMEPLMKTEQKKDTNVSKIFAIEPDTTAPPDTADIIPATDTAIAQIAPGSTLEIAVSGSTAKIAIWDAGRVDDDVVTVIYNGDTILKNYTITEDNKDIDLVLRPGTADSVQVIAVNEGTIPPNTARIRVTGGDEPQTVDASTTLDKPIWIVLKRK